MNDRTVRSLAYLEDSASTARVLNLLRVHRRRSRDPAHAANPFFKIPTLNRAIILKHRLRRNELDLFPRVRRSATKVILPIDGEDLRLGGRSVFVGQINYDGMMENFLGDRWRIDRSDFDLLTIIDELPSLDPFLLREQLRRYGREPARCYFDISNADMTRMFRFVEHEVQKLIDLCYKGVVSEAGERQGSRLAGKILSSSVDADTEPLRLALRLEKRDYQEGVFCWKGFLYYKWTLRETLPDVSRVADAVATLKPRGAALEVEAMAQLEKSRASLKTSILDALGAARKSLQYYDAAFAKLVDGQSQAFREFLLDAPSMFTELGERLGAVNHIVSFWNYRFPNGKMPVVTGQELADIVADFEESLAFERKERPPLSLAC
ncbi:MAG TPA: hypothetical protein VHW60_17165 [Caulobacteraceae bacterium]|nr:hypothetical protein [Caulobacteraceae bacterium]